MTQVETAYFALGCKVITEPVEAWRVFLTQAQSLQDEADRSQIVDGHTADDLKAAAFSGLKFSRSPNGCQYWHDNPDEVRAMRELIQNLPMD